MVPCQQHHCNQKDHKLLESKTNFFQGENIKQTKCGRDMVQAQAGFKSCFMFHLVTHVLRSKFKILLMHNFAIIEVVQKKNVKRDCPQAVCSVETFLLKPFLEFTGAAINLRYSTVPLTLI